MTSVKFLLWLKREHKEAGSGFWDNRNVLRRALTQGELWVIQKNGEAVAFQAPEIFAVQKNAQGAGLGKALAQGWAVRAKASGFNVLKVRCSPVTSWPFWKKMGFKRYYDRNDTASILARCIIKRTFRLPHRLPSSNVLVNLYPESVKYQSSPDNVKEVAACSLKAVNDQGLIRLGRRVVAFPGDERDGKHLVVKIEIDGDLILFSKVHTAKAREIGVEYNQMDGTFFIDNIRR